MKKELNLKIYGVVTIGPKGQIIIPKEARTENNLVIGNSYGIVNLDGLAFGIGNPDNKKINKEPYFKIIDCTEIKLGNNNQFVIPINFRNSLGLEIGDNLVVIGKGCAGLGFIKNDNLDYLLTYIKKSLEN